MGSSAKRKKEKAKDFQKPKLKVGKARPQNTNATNTSFQAKSISLKQQSLSAAAPSSTDQFIHNLSLLSSKTDSQRRDALSALTKALTARGDESLPQPAVTIIHKIRPLLIDASKTVRTSALDLLKLLPADEVERNIEAIQIYMHIGLTHMVSDIRVSSLDVLEWLLRAVGQSTVGCAGGWTGTLKRLQGIIGWQMAQTQNGTGAPKVWTNLANAKLQDAKSRARQITVFALLLETGLRPLDDHQDDSSHARAAGIFPLHNTDSYAIGSFPDPYRYLDLFAETDNRDEDGVAVADWIGRAAKLRDVFLPGILEGMEKAKKEGGEVGRAARKVELALANMAKVSYIP